MRPTSFAKALTALNEVGGELPHTLHSLSSTAILDWNRERYFKALLMSLMLPRYATRLLTQATRFKMLYAHQFWAEI